jgi:hypothetical protein
VSLVRFRIFAASHLENDRVLYSRLVIKVKSVEDQRLVLRVKKSLVGLGVRLLLSTSKTSVI